MPDDGSVQVLLQKLLRAEAAVAERKRRSAVPRFSKNSIKDEEGISRRPVVPQVDDKEAKEGRSRTGPPEMNMKNFKCFKCQAKGHIAKYCKTELKNKGCNTVSLKDKEDTEHTEIDEVAKEVELLWSRVVTEGASKSDGSGTSEVQSLLRSGPVYKTDVTIDGVKSQALLDHGSQITIVQRQMLPLVKEKHGWSMETCQQVETIGIISNWSLWPET